MTEPRYVVLPKPDDQVNHPPAYTRFSNGSEIVDITENLTFNRGNAVKYLARAGFKPGADELQDLLKAQWYVNREVERVEKCDDPKPPRPDTAG